MGRFPQRALVLLATLALPPAASATRDSWKLYDDSQVARIAIDIEPAALEWMLEHPESDSMHVATVHFENRWIDETVGEVGMRIRGNTSRWAEKKSFKLSFNSFVPGRQFYAVDKLNLNGEHNDPSIVRSKLGWDRFQEIGFIAPRAAHAALTINGVYHGLYISVEHVDDEFLQTHFEDDDGNLWKCLWPADLVYLGPDPDAYKLEVYGQRPYELKTHTDEDDYTELARLIDTINNTAIEELPARLESDFALARFLQYQAVNLLIGSWDDYWFLRNNYYLYHEPGRDHFHWIPYDYDNSFGIDFFDVDWTSIDPYEYANYEEIIGDPRGARPLADRLMEVPDYRDLYTHFLEFYRDRVFDLALLGPGIDALKEMITPFAEADTFRTLDYGFTIADFHASYALSGFSKYPASWGLKEFLDLRLQSLGEQLEWSEGGPLVYRLGHAPVAPTEYDSIGVEAAAFSWDGLAQVAIRWFAGDSAGATTIPMVHTPDPESRRVEDDDRWLGTIPPLGAGGFGSYEILVRAADGDTALFPRGARVPIRVGGIGIRRPLGPDPAPRAPRLRVSPSPFNPRTTIEVELGRAGRLELAAYDIAGRRVWHWPPRALPAGRHCVVWSASDELVSGVYLVRARTAEGRRSRRVVLLK